ncbi:mfs monocarboxylate [Moniliophthora roreri]|nr:mfs monocarboxylate [Moniliophthora roreri]
MPHKPSPSVDKASIVFLGISTAAAAQEKVQTKRNGVPVIVEVKPLPASAQVDVEAQLSGDILEGGFRSWLVIFGAFCCAFATLGYVYTWGVFQAYYQEVNLRDSREASVAWIGAIQARITFTVPVLHLLMLMIWTVFITHSPRFGCGALRQPTLSTSHSWWRERDFAHFYFPDSRMYSLWAFPTLSGYCNWTDISCSFAWAVRTIGFLMLFFLLLGNLTLGIRLPAMPLVESQTSSSEVIAVIRLPSQALHCLSTFLIFLGSYTLLTYVASKSHASLGNFAFYLTAVINASSGLGAILLGLLPDRSKFGMYSSLSPELYLRDSHKGCRSVLAIPLAGIAAAAVTYAWPFALAHSEACIIAVCVIYGFAIAPLSQPDTGVFPLIFRAFGSLLGAPLAGYVGQASGVGMGVFAGQFLLLSRRLYVIEANFCSGLIPYSFAQPMGSEATLPVTPDTSKDLDTEKDAAVIPSLEPLDMRPDSGLKAWLNVLGTFMVAFITYGYVNSWGIFQAYYQTDLLHESSTSAIAWIGSIQSFFALALMSVAGRLFDLGYFRHMLSIGGLTLVVATLLVAECHTYWQFLLVQGIITSFAIGITTGAGILIIPDWFCKHLGLAYGVAYSGSSLGGITIPVAARYLLPNIGFQWTIRFIAFLFLVGTIVACLVWIYFYSSDGILITLKDYEAKVTNHKRSKRPLFIESVQVASLRRLLRCHIFHIFGIFHAFVPVYSPMPKSKAVSVPWYISTTAQSLGFSDSLIFYLVSFFNAASCIGRLVGGVVADWMGSMNTQIPCMTVAALIAFVWPFAKTQASLIVIAVLYGLSSGVYIALEATPIVIMPGDPGDIGRRIGLTYIFAAVGSLLSLPIPAELDGRYGVKATGGYTGATILFGVLLIFVSRCIMLRKLWGKV